MFSSQLGKGLQHVQYLKHRYKGYGGVPVAVGDDDGGPVHIALAGNVTHFHTAYLALSPDFSR